MTLSEFFSNKYLFDPVPPSQSGLFWYLLGFFVLLILLSISMKFLRKIDKKIRDRHFNCFLTCGILGLVYLFSRHERLAWLGSRFFLLLILLTLVIWTLVIAVWLSKYYKKLDNKKILDDRYNKYLPSSKK